MTPVRTLLAAAVLVLAVLAVNAPTLDYGFVYDDQAVVLDRAPFWEQGWAGFFGQRQWGTGRHVAALSFDLNRSDPPSARPYHLTNTALAVVLTLLVFALARSLGMQAGAFVAALLFAVHPTHTDAVVSIIGRAETMAALCTVAIVLLHARGYPPRRLGLGVAALLMLAGLGSKENAAVAVLLIGLYDAVLGSPLEGRARLAPYAALAVGALGWLAINAGHFGSLDPIAYVDNPLAFMATYERVPRAALVLWRYLGLVLLPVGLVPDRAYAATDPELRAGIVALIALAVAAAGLWMLRRRFPRATFCMAWFPVSFAATANLLYPIGVVMAERLLLLPSVGPLLAIGLLFDSALSRGRAVRWVAWPVAALATLTLAFAYDARARVWSDDMHYHRVAAMESPRSAKAHYNLGLALARAGNFVAAETSFRRALSIYPSFSLAAYYLQGVLLDQMRPEDAAEVWYAYLRVEPNDTAAMSQLVALELSLDRFDAARATARRMTELEPDKPEYRGLLQQVEEYAAVNQVSP